MNEFQLSILKKSIKEWNKWRGENWNITPDLSGADLRKINLFKANMENVNLTSCDLRDAVLINTNFNNSNLEGCQMEGVMAQGAIFSNANLSNAILRNSNFLGAIFKGAILTGTDFSGANCTAANFIDSNTTETVFHDTLVEGANFEGSNIMDAHLYSDQFRNANIPLEQISEVEGKKQTSLSHAVKIVKLSSFLILFILFYFIVFTSEDPKLTTTQLRGSIYQQTANFYETIKQSDLSISYLHKAEMYNPDNPKIYFQLASLYRRTGDIPSAIKYYDKFLELDPATVHREGIEDYLYRNRGKIEQSGNQDLPRK
jgi:tetratricopeptide (TPR) repeat protein